MTGKLFVPRDLNNPTLTRLLNDLNDRTQNLSVNSTIARQNVIPLPASETELANYVLKSFTITTSSSLTGGGDLSGTGLTLDLSNTGVTPTSYGTATQAPQIVVDEKGRITTAVNVLVTPAYASITNIPAAIDAIDGLVPAADRFAYYTGPTTAALATYTATGTFTPALRGLTTAGTNTYSTQTGRFMQIGDLVYVYAVVTLATTSGMTGRLQMTGLPVASDANGGGALSLATMTGVTLTAGYTQVGILIGNATTTADFYQNGSGVAAADINSALVTGTASIVVAGAYMV